MSDDQQAQWTEQIQDVIADNSKIRENLTDDIALPFIEWGREIAAHVATRLAAPEAPPPDEQQIGDAGYNLARLMTRINWLVTYRAKKDAGWLAQTFAMVNKLSHDVYGEGAPALSDEEIAAWLADQANHTEEELIRDLMARYTPAAMRQSTEIVPTPSPDNESAPKLLSASVFGKPENLSDAIFGETSEHTPGEDEHDEEKSE